MGIYFIKNEDRNLLKISFDIVTSIYYYLNNPNIEIHSTMSDSKKALKHYVYYNNDIPEIDDIKGNLVANFLNDLGDFNLDINNPDPVFIEKLINTIENHKCYIGLIWFYDSLPRVDASFANLEMVEDFIKSLKSLSTEYQDEIYTAIINDLANMLELNEFTFGEIINTIVKINSNINKR